MTEARFYCARRRAWFRRGLVDNRWSWVPA